jgi:hypothetical protein
VEAGELAAAGVERLQGVEAAGELEVQMQLLGQRLLAQLRQGLIVAGAHGEHVHAVVEGVSKGPLELHLQGLDLRRQPGLRAALGPQQLLAERRQRGPLASCFHTTSERSELQLQAPQLAPQRGG